MFSPGRAGQGGMPLGDWCHGCLQQHSQWHAQVKAAETLQSAEPSTPVLTKIGVQVIPSNGHLWGT